MELDLGLLKKFFATQPVEKAWLFGSYARGEADSKSDVDILINFTEKTPIGMKFIRIITELEKILNREVDLVEESTLLPWVKPYVEKERVLIYERKN